VSLRLMNLRVVMALNSISPIFLKDTPDKGSVGFDTSYMRSRFEYGYELGRRTGVAIITAAAALTCACPAQTRNAARAFFDYVDQPSSSWPGPSWPVPAIHVLLAAQQTWMPGTSPGMTAHSLLNHFENCSKVPAPNMGIRAKRR
jgi:hypothetical protein